jgi:hypothetical protein
LVPENGRFALICSGLHQRERTLEGSFNQILSVMEKVTFSVQFFMRTQKLLRNGEARIFLRISVNGKAVEYTTSHSIHPDLWDTARGQAFARSRFFVTFGEGYPVIESITFLRSNSKPALPYIPRFILLIRLT